MTSPAPPGLPRPLRIGICAPYDLALDGGVNSHIRAQARALGARGHEVSVFGAASAPLDNGEVALGRSFSMVIGGTETGMGFDPRAWGRTAALLRARRFDVVHMHEPLMPFVPWCVLLQTSAPVVATFHTHREDGHTWYRRYGWALAPLMRRVRLRLAVSDAARRTVARRFPGDYAVVPNGIDVARFARANGRPQAMPAGGRHVLFVGRLEPRKGLDSLLRAIAAVQQQVAGVRLVVVGDGPDRSALEATARTLNIDVHFAGRVSDEELPGYYRAADVVCSPALGGESFGIVLLEALAASRPVVATRIDGYAELVGGEECARLVDAGDAAALAREIAWVLGHPDRGREMGDRGERFARAYDWAAIARRLEEMYVTISGGSVRL